MLRAFLLLICTTLLLACSSSDEPEATPTAAATSTPQLTATPAPTQTPVVVVVTATPVPPQPAAAPAPQQPSGPPPGQVACAVATGPEIQALNALATQLLAGAPAAQQLAIRGAMAQVDRNNDGAVDPGVCRDAVVAVTLALNALRR